MERRQFLAGAAAFTLSSAAGAQILPGPGFGTPLGTSPFAPEVYRARRAWRIDEFYRGLGHYVGLDVHDPFDRSKPIPDGAVITIEPGLYAQSANQGIRIEDQYRVTATGSERMSVGVPRSVAEIEAMMRG